MRRFETASENLEGCCICVAALIATLYRFAKGLASVQVIRALVVSTTAASAHSGVAGVVCGGV